ncbi:isoleucine--tRNA ligase, cytoplasmic-like [Hibiscus syriacus]|uniref:isoleucine--tRNA ligase, cytoplasmic-like n=1 Tax=Hibiscus syriacus TaxID=106335 RepID=UPI001920ED36|nr:isoleucine--tRNA ligase, cytoplasmic-like [Hibiscus syriacus]
MDSASPSNLAVELIYSVLYIISQGCILLQENYIRDAIGSPLLSSDSMPIHAVVICEEIFQGIYNISFKISLVRPALVFKENAILALYAGNSKFAADIPCVKGPFLFEVRVATRTLQDKGRLHREPACNGSGAG